MTLAEFGRQLKDYRKAHSLSQYELGRLCGVSQSTICAVELGHTRTGEPFLPFQKTVDRIQRVIGGDNNIDITPPTRKEPTMNNAEIDKRNTAKLRAILLALLNEEDAPETTPAPVTPPPAPAPEPKPEPEPKPKLSDGFRVDISYNEKNVKLTIMDGDREVVSGRSYIRHYRDANNLEMDMVAAISYAAHMAYKAYEQKLIEGGLSDD